MATWETVTRIALALPETVEVQSRQGLRAWCVKDKSLAWERPLRKSDLAALGDAAPKGPILAMRVADLVTKETVLASDPDVFFTTAHFNGYPAVLIRLPKIRAAVLKALLHDAWLDRAPKQLVAKHFGTRSPAKTKSPAKTRSSRRGS
jgi:hypothetical protein